jgi:protein kinase A
VIIDFGFAKRIVVKTYTMCGTPLYIPPEILLNRGHTWSADHWSLGVVLFEMLVGYTPFYRQGMSKSDLFRAIVQSKLRPPPEVSPEALSLLSGLLRRDPVKRLGSLANGEDDIINHPWFQLDGFDIDQLFLQQLKPPHVPVIKNPLDGSNFSDWSHVDNKLVKHYPPLTSEQAAIFADF